MDYQLKTHCPNCFKLSNTAVCGACQFDRDVYVDHDAAAHHLPLFSRLDKGYVIGRVLGESGFAIVYAAIREKDLLSSAIKEFYPPDLVQRGLDGKTVKPKLQAEQFAYWQRRFNQEAELLRSCYDHPSVEAGVVHYTALFEQHNTSYLVLERLNGINLNDYLLERKQLSPAQICLWLKPLLETLLRLHAKDIYHRNISAKNIFLAEVDRPVFMDFGLGREGAHDATLKAATVGAGTFIAPEQLIGGACDQRTDLYALGAVIYLCLQGEPPPSVEERRQGVMLTTFTFTDKAAQALQIVATHCLQLNLNLRPKNAAHILADLAPFWTTSTAAPAAVETTPHYQAADLGLSRLNPTTRPMLSPLPAKPQSFFRSFVMFLCIVAALMSLAYGGFIAYQSYDLREAEKRKQDNLLFSQAQTIADYKKYLTTCITCENQQRAMERVAQLELDQQNQLSQQKQYEQEALLFSKAQTADDFNAYLSSCVQCADRPTALEKLAELNEVLKQADEKQLLEQEKEITTALASKSSSIEFYQQNCPKNLTFWQRTAEQGYAIAQVLLGGCYRSGDGVKQDYAQTLKWYRKAAEQGNMSAQHNLGMMYQNGYGTPKNNAEAAKWYRKAADQGQVNAQFLLGTMYEKGQGVTQDYKQAVDWYLRAAEQGNAQAQYSLGAMYHFGTGVNQDYQSAVLWYEKSAGQGNAKAQYLMGVMYQNGYGVDMDEQEAMQWYKKAAKKGNPEAMAQIKVLDTATKIPDLPESIDAGQ